MEDRLFVGITNPVEMRRNLLECSREVISSMEMYEAILKKKKEKTKLYKSLLHILKELSLLVDNLDKSLPRNKNVPKSTPTSTKNKGDTIDIIEEELDSLEKELKGFREKTKI